MRADQQSEPEVGDVPATLTAAAAAAGDDLTACLRLAAHWGSRLPYPGRGDTQRRWELLAATAAGDLTAARVLEPHADALAILDEAGLAAGPGVWGVFAAEAPDATLWATEQGNQWRLNGTKPWCSLAARLDRALVTAHTDDGRRLFAVELHSPGVHPRSGTWVARGLRAVDSGPVAFHSVPAEPVGGIDWYFARPGFAWGGIGVAACWWGGASALVATLAEALADKDPDPVRAVSLGAADVAAFAGRCSMRTAAVAVDGGLADGVPGALLAARVRALVHDAAEDILRQVGHALGPAPLTFDEVHARRVADLEVYLRQHHAERDLARLGTQIRDAAAAC